MGWVLRLVETGIDSPPRVIDVMDIRPLGDLGDIANLGLTLSEAKQILARLQQVAVAVQADDHAARRPDCSSCGDACHVKDWRLHRVATLFGTVSVRLPRFRCASCGHGETGISWRSYCRSTPELDQLRAHVSALMPYRVAAGLLEHLLPVEIESPETLRGHTLKIGEQLRDAATVKPPVDASAITITLDSTFIRGCRDGERHLEVRVGNVETSGGGRQVFGAVAKVDTEIAVLIRRSLETVGRAADTELTAFTDGCSGLQSILAEAGCQKPIADWFHIAMRLQHAKQAASGLATDTPGRRQARVAPVPPHRSERARFKAVIVAKVERLHWRIWNGKAKNARRTLERVRKVMHVFRGEGVHRTTAVPSSRKLWRALREVDKYLRGQSTRLVNYAKRYRAGLRVGTSVTEGTANFLVNRRMNKQQQMRWSRRGADLLLQVRCAVYNGLLGSGFGNLFEPTPDTVEQSSLAA
jgi:hypothetical protein